ncbi:MAG: sn-glycerol-3-phosphate ABC transporter ATP-binding protein UgpC [Pseudomonadota bacterium]|nr:sn-glycerol-3-phosphate ABC transporter ATP-binding protein UgpC [Pseudomonadota bacterium]
MATLDIKGLEKSWGEVKILKGIDLDISDGEFVVLVGPSGCGKSTLLRLIAGLDGVSKGEIRIGGRRVNELEPAARKIAMVFQSYALYPHMNVAKNMTFGLKFSDMPKAEIDRRVADAARMLQLEPLLERRPRDLSGGQRQRVAIGRAIVREPDVFLFDEPLSNLDAALRVSTRVEIAKLHRLLGATMVYVTHDQTEAMTLADRIVVMNQGEIAQVGRPLDLYYTPANLFVARFIGSPAMNLFEASAPAAGRLAGPAFDAFDAPASRAAKLGVRPEHLRLGGEGAFKLPATVELVERLGEISYAHARSRDGQAIVAELRGRDVPAIGDAVVFAAAARDLHLFDDAGRRVSPAA